MQNLKFKIEEKGEGSAMDIKELREKTKESSALRKRIATLHEYIK